MVDSEDGSSSSKSLVERLEEAPKKFFDVMTATSKNCLTHMISGRWMEGLGATVEGGIGGYGGGSVGDRGVLE